jgi:hypothetical protein
MCPSEDEGLSNGKNYALNFIRQLMKIGVQIRSAIESMEDRFLSSQDKDFLLMILDSMRKGQKVEVKKIKQHIEIPQTSSAPILSIQDKNNVLQIYEMFGGEHSR